MWHCWLTAWISESGWQEKEGERDGHNKKNLRKSLLVMQTLSCSLVFLNYKVGINRVSTSWDAWGSKESITKDKQTDRTKHVKQHLRSCPSVSLVVVVTAWKGEIKQHSQVWSTRTRMGHRPYFVMESSPLGPWGRLSPLDPFPPAVEYSPRLRLQSWRSSSRGVRQCGRADTAATFWKSCSSLTQSDWTEEAGLDDKCHNWRLLSWCVLNALFAQIVEYLNAYHVLILSEKWC